MRGLKRSGPLRRFFAAFGYASRGLWVAVLTQRNMRIHLVIMTIGIALAFWLHFSLLEWAIYLLTVALVIGAELLNTAVEAVVDLASPEFHPMAGRAKDVAAGAVLFCVVLAVLIGCFIFGPRILALFS